VTKVKVARQEYETKPWEWERVAMVVLAVVGIFVAGYLAWAEVTGNNTACLDTGSIVRRCKPARIPRRSACLSRCWGCWGISLFWAPC